MKFYTAAITLVLVMDPLGNVPIFLSLLSRFDRKKQLRIIFRECFIAFLILSLFLFFGRYILAGLHLSMASLSIAGGIILFIISLKMIFPAGKDDYGAGDGEPFVVPLAVPLTAGPSALATVVLFSTRDPQHMGLWFFAVLLSCVVFTLVMLLAPLSARLLDKRILTAIERLMGMVLTIISVQMLLSGIEQFLRSGAQ